MNPLWSIKESKKNRLNEISTFTVCGGARQGLFFQILEFIFKNQRVEIKIQNNEPCYQSQVAALPTWHGLGQEATQSFQQIMLLTLINTSPFLIRGYLNPSIKIEYIAAYQSLGEAAAALKNIFWFCPIQCHFLWEELEAQCSLQKYSVSYYIFTNENKTCFQSKWKFKKNSKINKCSHLV